MLRYKPNQALASMSQVSPLITLSKKQAKQTEKENKTSTIKKGNILNSHTQSLHENYSKKEFNKPKAYLKTGNIKSYDCQSHEHHLSTNPTCHEKQEHKFIEHSNEAEMTAAATSECQNCSIINQLYSASTSKNNSPIKENRKQEQVDCESKFKRFDYLSGTIRNNYHPEYKPHYKFDREVTEHTKNWSEILQKKEKHMSSKRDLDKEIVSYKHEIEATHLKAVRKAFEEINVSKNANQLHYASLYEFQDTNHPETETKNNEFTKNKNNKFTTNTKTSEKMPPPISNQSLPHKKLGESKEKEIYEKLNLLGERCASMLHSVNQKESFLQERQIGREENRTNQENNWAFEQKQKIRIKEELNFEQQKPNICSNQTEKSIPATNRFRSKSISDEKPPTSPLLMHPPCRCSESQHQCNCQIENKVNVSRLSHLNSKLESYIQMNLRKF